MEKLLYYSQIDAGTVDPGIKAQRMVADICGVRFSPLPERKLRKKQVCVLLPLPMAYEQAKRIVLTWRLLNEECTNYILWWRNAKTNETKHHQMRLLGVMVAENLSATLQFSNPDNGYYLSVCEEKRIRYHAVYGEIERILHDIKKRNSKNVLTLLRRLETELFRLENMGIETDNDECRRSSKLVNAAYQVLNSHGRGK